MWVVDDALFAGWDQDGHDGIHVVLVAMEIEVVFEQPMRAFGVGVLQRRHSKTKRVPDGVVGGVGDMFVGGVVRADEPLSHCCVGGGGQGKQEKDGEGRGEGEGEGGGE